MDEEDSANLRKMAKGGGILILGAFATKAIMYFYRILVAQELGTAAYGLLTQGLAVFSIFMVFSNLGIGSGISRFVSDNIGKEKKENIPGIMWAALTLTMPLSILAALILFLSADFIAVNIFKDSELSVVFRIFSLAIPFQMLYKNASTLSFAFKEAKYVTYVDKLWRSLATFGITAVLIFLGYQIEGAVIAQFAAIATSALFMLYLAQFKVYPFLQRDFKWKGNERRKILSYSWPIFLSGIVGLSTSWADTVLLGFYSTSETVGVYNAAVPTASLLTLFSSQMGNMLFPTVSEYYGKGMKEKSVKFASIALKWVYFFTFPSLLIMMAFPSQILNLLFGKEFVGGAVALSVLGTAYFMRTITMHSSTYINSEDRTKLNFLNAIAISILNIALNALLIPGYQIGGLVIPELGLSGAAVATAISLSLGSLLATAEVYFLFGVQPYKLKRFMPATVSAVVSSLIVLLIFRSIFEKVPKLMLIPALMLFGVLYIVLYILLGGISEDDLEIVRSIENKTNLPLEYLLNKVRKHSLR